MGTQKRFGLFDLSNASLDNVVILGHLAFFSDALDLIF